MIKVFLKNNLRIVWISHCRCRLNTGQKWVRHKNWTGLCRKSNALSVFEADWVLRPVMNWPRCRNLADPGNSFKNHGPPHPIDKRVGTSNVGTWVKKVPTITSKQKPERNRQFATTIPPLVLGLRTLTYCTEDEVAPTSIGLQAAL